MDKYENNEKGGYFWFDDDNNMSYRYILSIPLPYLNGPGEHMQIHIL